MNDYQKPRSPQNIVAIIPARAGSKGLPGKNVKLLGGKPLYEHSVTQALESGCSSVFISTDIEEIISNNQPKLVKVVQRPQQLALSTTTMAEVLLDFLCKKMVNNATIVILQPTSPLRRREHIQNALSLFEESENTMVMSVCETDPGVLKYGTLNGDRFLPLSDHSHCFANRQSLPKVFRPNGAIYVFDAETFRRTGRFPYEKIGVMEMSQEDSIDIDNSEDFGLCEKIMKKRAY